MPQQNMIDYEHIVKTTVEMKMLIEGNYASNQRSSEYVNDWKQAVDNGMLTVYAERNCLVIIL